jgi:hypothetical protein
MMANFKKLGVAAAVASALGASGAAHAVLLGAPGDALLIPHVIAADSAGGVVNTLIGVTVASNARTNAAQFADLSVLAPNHPAGVGTLSVPKDDSLGCGRSGARIHWYFFDMFSDEVVNDTIPVTCEDFVRIDWNYIIESKALPSAEGLPGYLVITDAAARPDRKSQMILYGAAYLIQGNWASMAYIPVLPLVDSVDGTQGDEVDYESQDFIDSVNPVTAGMLLPSAGTNPAAIFSMRYFLDPALNGSTAFVLWFPENQPARNNETILVYDADQRNISARTDIPCELNILNVAPDAVPATGNYASCRGFIRDGLVHTNTDGTGVSAVGPAVNTGFVLFNVADYRPPTATFPSTVTPGEESRAGFAFSLIGVGGANALQIQTELAHERGLR